MVRIKSIIAEHPDNDNYGVRRIQIALKQCGVEVSLRTVYRTMCEGGLLHQVRRTHGITKATTEIQEQENLIKRNFSAEKPYIKLLTDITEVPCSDGKLYVSPIMDCCSGEILSLEMRDNMVNPCGAKLFPIRGKRLTSGNALTVSRGKRLRVQK